MSTFSDEWERLAHRYETDPVFRATVLALNPGGWTDNNGVHHERPTVATAKLAAKVLTAVAQALA